MLRFIENGRIAVATCPVSGINDALDMMADAFANHCGSIIIEKGFLPDAFFSLKTRLAGEILQKFSNYGIRLAIVGDFENTGSESLAAFIRECNRGHQVFFKNTEQEAVSALCGA